MVDGPFYTGFYRIAGLLKRSTLSHEEDFTPTFLKLSLLA